MGRVRPSTTASNAFSVRVRESAPQHGPIGAERHDRHLVGHPLHAHRVALTGGDPPRELEVVDGGEDLTGAGDVAEPRGEVDRPADVVVALEEDDVTRRDAATEVEVRDPGVALLDGEGRAHQGLGVDPDEHEPVAEPLLDPDAEHGSHLPDGCAEDLELVDRTVVAVLVDEVGEPAQVDEGEGAMDAVIGGDGGELCGVHGFIGRPRRPETTLM